MHLDSGSQTGLCVGCLFFCKTLGNRDSLRGCLGEGPKVAGGGAARWREEEEEILRRQVAGGGGGDFISIMMLNIRMSPTPMSAAAVTVANCPHHR